MNKRISDVSVALGAALAASACCTVPLLLVSLGIGGAWLGNLSLLAPYRPFFTLLALGFLGVAIYRQYRSSRRPDCACEQASSSRTKQTLTVAGGLLTLALIAAPWLVTACGVSEVAETKPPLQVPTRMQEVVLRVEGMTCAACTITVSKALKRLEGVLEATVTETPPQAVVRYDADRVTVEALTAATAHAGYPSFPVSHEVHP